MKYRPLMILGAGSDVGKSILVTALCRIFARQGIRVAPFKAQNMALNSWITPEGLEMGRAQVVQAQAAGLVPSVDMNPILLKPSSETGSQVIVHGKIYGNFSARDYYRHKPKLVRRVMASFRRLAAAYDLIILEGAGSAVELNLKKNDLVNFSMARRVNAAVLLVADIDRGGVFAATIGSYHLLTPAERRLLAGFIINKFRGDRSLFADGVQIIEKRTGRRVVGVVPYLKDLALPQEDSVALERKTAAIPATWADNNKIRIGVLRLPHLSNYTDFDPLEQEAGVVLRYLVPPVDLEPYDLIIIPGTKNTLADLQYLRDTGLAAQLQAYARQGGRIVGICGGYQIMGEVVRDPTGMESPLQELPGLGLLPVTTVMATEKTTTLVEAEFLGVASRPLVEGYEIHLGQTWAHGSGQPVFRLRRRLGQEVSLMDGWATPDFRLWGTYIHGLFDSDAFRREFLAQLGAATGKSASSTVNFAAFRETQFDRLAEAVRTALDLDYIYRLIRSL